MGAARGREMGMTRRLGAGEGEGGRCVLNRGGVAAQGRMACEG